MEHSRTVCLLRKAWKINFESEKYGILKDCLFVAQSMDLMGD
jgi:hypothetical protein